MSLTDLKYAKEEIKRLRGVVLDRQSQLAAVTKERDELRAAVKRVAGNLDAAATRCREDYQRWEEMILYRNLLSAALSPEEPQQ